jgi:hypothetical protein
VRLALADRARCWIAPRKIASGLARVLKAHFTAGRPNWNDKR